MSINHKNQNVYIKIEDLTKARTNNPQKHIFNTNIY